MGCPLLVLESTREEAFVLHKKRYWTAFGGLVLLLIL
jgi:hypothetical protein